MEENNMNDATEAPAPAQPAVMPTQSMPLNLFIDAGSMTSLINHFREALEPMIATALSQVQQRASPPPQPVEPTPSNSSSTKGVDLKPTERLKAADLRVALLLGKIPENGSLLIDARTFARLLGIGASTFYRLLAEEAIPTPVQLGRLKKWRLTEILEWIEADCPPLNIWVHKRRDLSRRKGR
jgi:predicted DNA-binding transcriptional regulator AlpA